MNLQYHEVYGTMLNDLQNILLIISRYVMTVKKQRIEKFTLNEEA